MLCHHLVPDHSSIPQFCPTLPHQSPGPLGKTFDSKLSATRKVRACAKVGPHTYHLSLAQIAVQRLASEISLAIFWPPEDDVAGAASYASCGSAKKAAS